MLYQLSYSQVAPGGWIRTNDHVVNSEVTVSVTAAKCKFIQNRIFGKLLKFDFRRVTRAAN